MKKSYVMRCAECEDIVLAGEIDKDARIIEGTVGFCVTCRKILSRPWEMTVTYGKAYPGRVRDLLEQVQDWQRSICL